MTDELRAFIERLGSRVSDAQRTALETLAAQGGSMSADALASAIGVPAFRINGFVALLQERVNADGDEILFYDPTARELRLELGRVQSARPPVSRPMTPAQPSALTPERNTPMSIQKPLDSLVEFARNPDQRAPCVLVLDTSSSMDGEPIQELQAGLVQYKRALEGDVLARRRVETAIITFDSEARVEVPFTLAGQLELPALEAGGYTHMASAILLALQTLEERKATYKQAGIPYYRPWLILMTDGAPTDSGSIDAARAALLEAEKSKKVFPTMIGIGGADMDFLKTLSVRKPVRMKQHAFEEFFVWLSKSMERVSGSQPGDGVQIDRPDDWGYIEP